MDKGQYHPALSIVNKLKKMTAHQDENHLASMVLEGQIISKMGSHQKALRLAQDVFQESKNQGYQLLAVDALILKSGVLGRLSCYTESLTAVDEGEAILSRIKEIDPLAIKARAAKLAYCKGANYGSVGLGDLTLQMKFIQKALTLQEELGDKNGIASSLNVIANCHLSKGELDQALVDYMKSLDLFKEINDLGGTGIVFGNISLVYYFKGELDEALEYAQNAKAIQVKIGNKYFIAGSFLIIGNVYWLQGKLSEALEHLQKATTIFEEINSKFEMALSLGFMGIVYANKGVVNKALKNLQTSTTTFQELGITKNLVVGWLYRDLGRVYHIMGNFERALHNYQESLDIFEEIKNNLLTATSLYYLAKISIEINSLEQATGYVNHLKRISKEKEYRNVSQLYRVAQAILLKTGGRTIQKAEAQTLLEQVDRDDPFSLELAVDVYLNLADLLLDELKSSGDEELLKEIKTYSSKLLELSKTQDSYYLLSETYLLQSKLALLEMNVKESEQLLSQAEFIAEEKDLGELTSKINKEKDLLLDLIRKFEKLADQQPSMSEIIELTKLEDLFEKMQRNRIYSKEKQVIEYALQARALVQAAGRD